ncbi:cupin domain-containing protein [Alteromonas sp. BMJM2]|nr:cupin domain-containing protein [Alteromonas sp. BMJM2]
MHPLIQKYDLAPHTEGGYFKQVYKSASTTMSHSHGQPRTARLPIFTFFY